MALLCIQNCGVVSKNGARRRRDLRRVAWAIVGDAQLTQHNGSAQVFDIGTGRPRVVRIADLLPYAAASTIARFMELGSRDIKATLEQQP